jgi:hypothetical protein
MNLKVSENHRFLTWEDNSPFFYLGDTAWELFHRLNLTEAEHYLRDRASKQFTVIQAVVLAEFGGLSAPNAQGHLPLFENDPMQPNEAYFRHVDAIVDMAESLGLFIGMLPTWGDKWNRCWGDGPEIFTPENAHAYGMYLGKRYISKPIIWILGGDRPVETEHHINILSSMARGLHEGDRGNHLISFHPSGGHCSSEYFRDANWLDFHMWQSGHDRNRNNYDLIAETYQLSPIKPVMDAEPGYEDHASSFNLNNGYLDDYDARKAAYWSLFSGAHGHTYGCHPVWQFMDYQHTPVTWVRRLWREALLLPGSGQMRHLRALLESRPFLHRIPDQNLVQSDNGAGTDHVCATRDVSGSYAMIYLPSGKPVDIDLSRLSGSYLNVFWYDPRTGISRKEGCIPRKGIHKFTPPGIGPDWVLVLDDKNCLYPEPGRVTR